MRAIRYVLCAGLAALLATGVACTRHYAEETTDHVNLANVDTKIVTQLTGDQEVPSVASDGRGVATFYIMKDGGLEYELLVDDMEAITAAHLHAGDVQQNGPPVVHLYRTDQPTGKVNGVLVRGRVADRDLMGPWQGRTVADVNRELQAGRVYVNVHTTQHPQGEIRGDIPFRR